MKGRSLKGIIFRHAIISILLLSFSIAIFIYNTVITLIFDIYNSKFENEVQMTARYLDMFLEDTAESFLPIDEKIPDISKNEKVMSAGFLKSFKIERETSIRYSPVNSNAFFHESGLNDKYKKYFISIASIRDLADLTIINEISIVYPLNDDIFFIIILDRAYINNFISNLRNSSGFAETIDLFNSGGKKICLQDTGNLPENTRNFRYALKNGFYVSLNVSYSEIEADINKIKISIFVVLIIFSLWLFFQLKLIRRFISSPINRMKDLITFISRGRFDIKLHDESYYEITELSDKLDMMVEKISQLTREIYEKEILTTQANIKTLQAQVNPHFLLNTLNSLKLMAINHKDKDIIQTIDVLGDLLHYGLYDQNKNVSVKDELDNIKNYVVINQARFRKDIVLEINCPEELEGHQMLKLLLQPVVENSIKYGFLQDRAFEIKIDVLRERLVLIFVISDNGNGIEKGKLTYLREQLAIDTAVDFSSNLGLKNVNNRIKMKYGKQYGLSISSEQGIGTAITIRIPDII